MNSNMKTILIVAGLALAGYLAYKYMVKSGSIAPIGTASGSGSSSLLSDINTYGSAASTGLNDVYGWFGGSSTGGSSPGDDTFGG